MYSHFRHGIPVLEQGGSGATRPSFVTHPDQFSNGLVQPVQPYLNELQQYVGGHSAGTSQVQLAQLQCVSSIWNSLLQTYAGLLTDAQRQNPFALDSVHAMVRRDIRSMALTLFVLNDVHEEYRTEYVECNYCKGSGRSFWGPCQVCHGHGILFVKSGRAYVLS